MSTAPVQIAIATHTFIANAEKYTMQRRGKHEQLARLAKAV